MSYLHILINSLQNLVIPKHLFVRFIFSDNASTDGSYETLTQANLNNKTVFLQEKDIGGWGNINFLLNKIQSEYFMFIDGHDYISKFYLEDFYNNVTLQSDDTAYIGNVITLQEEKGKFYPINIQQNYEFARFRNIRNLQLSVFLFHNSIYHAIFPTRQVNMGALNKSKSWSLDHLITHAGLANCKLKYLDKSFYVRRYREIFGGDFTHYISGELVTRRHRGLGNSNLSINDMNIAEEIVELLDYGNYIMKILVKLFINGKFRKSRLSFLIYRIARFVANKILRANPLNSEIKSVAKEVYDDIVEFENLRNNQF
jgi:hypothetical protein